MKKKAKTASKSAAPLRVKDLKAKLNWTGKIAQDVTVNKAKTQDKAFKAMNDYIRG